VEVSSSAGIPATSICLNCHEWLFRDQPLLAPVRASRENQQPLRWTRVHDVPDFANFNHSIHIHKGIGCVTCHGRVDRMPLMWRKHSLLMEWCLQCHMNPTSAVRPREFVFRMESLEELAETPAFARYLRREFPELDSERPDLDRLREELAERYGLREETDCSNCHW
jgi:MoCo/4Fe-4S cofactor protein with predicted Tat translocation signal